ncbi:MAG: phage portal protein [Chloroflexota bacterium]|nr:phage portal protein [Chloroflexota bacterium]
MQIERLGREAQIDENWDYYDGRQRQPLKVRKNQSNDNVIINLTRRIVEQSVAMLFSEMPAFDLPGDSDAIQSWEERLGVLWERNRGEILLHDIGVSGALAGHVFVKIVPVEDDPERPVRFVLQNPRYCSVFWKPDDMQQVVCYRIAWGRRITKEQARSGSLSLQQARDEYRQDIINEGDYWRIREWTRGEQGNWSQVNEDIWRYPFAPLVDWQNLPHPERYYGDSDLAAGALLDEDINLNDAVNFVASNINRILRYHAHPKSLGFGIQPQQIVETAVDGFWAGLPTDARVENLEMQSDLASSMAFLEFLERTFYAQHRAVDLSSVKDRVGQLTNFGLRTMFKDALDKLETKRTLYGTALSELSWRAMQVAGWNQERPTVAWPNPLPFHETEEVAVLTQEMSAKILSRQSAAEQRGRDWERELKRMEEERDLDREGLGQVLARAMRDFDRDEGASPSEPIDGGKPDG